jgi:cytochrome c peroxidase
LIWDGRAPNLEKQALGPVKNPIHMNQNINLLVAKLHAVPGYVTRFQEAFGEGPSPATIAKALATFERTLVTRHAPFDRYMQGEKTALSPAAVRGLALFRGKARCVLCHNGPNFTDGQFHNLGLPQAPFLTHPLVQATIRFDAQRMGVPHPQQVTTDLGRYLVTKDTRDIGAFKTPTLRNVTDRGSFMHNGIFATLDEVIDFYDRGGESGPHKSSLMQPLHLTSDEKQDLLAFLESLTGELPKVSRPVLPPYGQP